MDYETLKNCFLAVYEDVKSDNKKIFVCHESRNDIFDLITFLEHNIAYNEWHISFNGLAFDAQITQHIIKNKQMLLASNGDKIARFLYYKAQDVISRQNRGEFAEFKPKQIKINQIDLFKLNHWDNPAKRSSLKWIQYTMDWANIVDMPIHHTKEITAQEVDTVISYCINDVKSTKAILMLSKSQIDLRKNLTMEYNIDLFSASEPRISKELFLHFLSEKTGYKKWDLKELRTYRSLIKFEDIILPYTKFETATFQNLLKKFKEIELDPMYTKGGFKYSVQYKGVKTDFGLGGVHGARTAGVYESDDDMVIMSSDVVSYYPNLAIRNKWAPYHLPKAEFCDLYEWFFNERKKISKKDPKNYVYKIILNSTYGLSNDENSFLYDPEFTMRITVNGQLSLMMLYEMICEEIPDVTPLMQNTDGLETMIPRKYYDKYMEICERWQNITNLQLEHDTYSKVILGDVNNYIAVTERKKIDNEVYEELKKKVPYDVYEEINGEYFFKATKSKGRFEFSNLALHKNKSFLIIPKAIFMYFVHGIKPEDYFLTENNIFDYCGGVKIKGNWEFVEHLVESVMKPEYAAYTIEQQREYLLQNGWEQSWSEDNWVRPDQANKDHGLPTDYVFRKTAPREGGVYVKNNLQDTLRYYISTKGSKIIKSNRGDNREIQIEAGRWLQTVYVKHVEKPFEEYGIDLRYYSDKVYKEIHSLEPVVNQLKLF